MARHSKSVRAILSAAIKCSAIGICLGASYLAAQTAGANARPQPKIVNNFEQRVTKYLKLRKQEAGTAPKPTNSPQQLAASEVRLAEKVKRARAGAKQGDIFTPHIAEYFRKQIAATLAGPEGPRIRASLRRAEPVNDVKLEVNKPYPNGAPLQSTPPSLLLNLPRLPRELEYRIAGCNLFLHDIAANVIVDFVPDAIPRS